MSWLNRRELMRVGGLSLAGIGLTDLLRAEQVAPPNPLPSFGRAKSIIFLYLNGGPPQHETFDPKPNAPAEVRGVFSPIQTNVPGIQICELLPRTAAIADKMAIVRSMATDDHIHSSSGHWVLTGYKYQGPNARTIQTTDWPYFGSIVKRYRPSAEMPALSALMIPDVIRLNENVMPAGQTGGAMGSRWSPERFVGDPSRADYHIDGLEPLGMSAKRVQQRRSLLGQLEQRMRAVDSNHSLDLFNTYQQQAYELLTSGRARKAFAINEESAKVRDRYGRNRWGQCVLLARRLIESGVRLVHVNWPREPGDNAVDNPLWDTHAQNHDRVEDVLCPMFDVGFSALIEDLDERGMLEETLVVAIGEFGRTPKINAKAGRDHWGSVFSFAIAGAGISGGQVYGSSDRSGAYPKSNRLEPGHLTSSMFHLVGLDYRGTFGDPIGRRLSLTKQRPVYELFGDRPATDKRIASTGDISRVPPFDETRILAASDFTADQAILPVKTPSRPKGWRSLTPVLSSPGGLGIRLAPPTRLGEIELPKHVFFGVGDSGPNRGGQIVDPKSEVQLTGGERFLLAQEVRSPFAGAYELTLSYVFQTPPGIGDGYDNHFEFRLVYLQFTSRVKQIDAVRELAAEPFVLAARGGMIQSQTFRRDFKNNSAGGNFSFGLGMAVGVSIRRRTKGAALLKGTQPVLRLTSVKLDFLGKTVNEDVTV